MDRSDLRQSIEALLDQLADDELLSFKQYLESFLAGNRKSGESQGETGEQGAAQVSFDNPSLINLASDLGVAPEELMRSLGDYERDLLTTYIESGDTGMLITLRKALGLPIFR